MLSGWTAPFAFALGLACYLNCTACDFVFDDRLAILDNKDVQHGSALAPIWTNDFWGKNLSKKDIRTWAKKVAKRDYPAMRKLLGVPRGKTMPGMPELGDGLS